MTPALENPPLLAPDTTAREVQATLVPSVLPGTPSELQPAAPKQRGFYPGHPRYGGIRKGTKLKRTKEAQEVAAALGFHPVEWFAQIALTGFMTNADGTKTQVDTAARMEAGKHITGYILPKPVAVQVTGKNGGPVAVAALDVAAILANPALADAAQQLALMVVEQEISDESSEGD